MSIGISAQNALNALNTMRYTGSSEAKPAQDASQAGKTGSTSQAASAASSGSQAAAASNAAQPAANNGTAVMQNLKSQETGFTLSINFNSGQASAANSNPFAALDAFYKSQDPLNASNGSRPASGSTGAAGQAAGTSSDPFAALDALNAARDPNKNANKDQAMGDFYNKYGAFKSTVTRSA